MDQRLIGFTFKEEISDKDKTVIHALFNCVLGMFYIEALGFGRGLGALDLSKDKIEQNYRMLDYTILSEGDKDRIIEAFEPLMNRNRQALPQEMEREDRAHFDEVLFEVFNIQGILESVRNALMVLYRIRLSVTKD